MKVEKCFKQFNMKVLIAFCLIPTDCSTFLLFRVTPRSQKSNPSYQCHSFSDWMAAFACNYDANSDKWQLVAPLLSFSCLYSKYHLKNSLNLHLWKFFVVVFIQTREWEKIRVALAEFEFQIFMNDPLVLIFYERIFTFNQAHSADVAFVSFNVSAHDFISFLIILAFVVLKAS